MKLSLLVALFSLSAFAQDSLTIKCEEKFGTGATIELKVGIHETAVDKYEINAATSTLVTSTDKDIVMVNPVVVENVMDTNDGYSFQFDAYNGYDANFKREIGLVLNQGSLGNLIYMVINDESTKDEIKLLKCDDNLEELFGYIGF